MPRCTLPPITRHRLVTPSEIGERVGWQLTDYGIDQRWNDTFAGEGIRVGVIDTGLDEQHVMQGDLANQIGNARDFTRSRRGVLDMQGHGTHVSGIIAAVWNNNQGIAGGAPRAKIFMAKGLGDDGSGDDRGVAACIIWLVDDCKVHLINLSLGSPQPSQALREACAYAASRGVILVCATGNDGSRDGVDYPAAYDTTIGVGAIDRRKQLATFSDRGPQCDLVAPGVRILSCYLNGGYSELSGTSMATPWFAGLVANLLSYELHRLGAIRTKTAADLLALVAQSSEDLGPPGHDTQYGRGVPTPTKLLQPPTPTDPTDPGQPYRIGDHELFYPVVHAGHTGIFIAEPG